MFLIPFKEKNCIVFWGPLVRPKCHVQMLTSLLLRIDEMNNENHCKYRMISLMHCNIADDWIG